MSFGDHLEELRRRIIWAFAVPLPAAIILFFFSNTLVELLLLPLLHVLEAKNLPVQVQQLSPPEFLLVRIKLSLILAIILSSPWIIWQFWLFISPGLYRHEQRFVHLLLPGSGVLTIVGLLLMYFGMLPLILLVLVETGRALNPNVMELPYDPPAAATERSPAPEADAPAASPHVADDAAASALAFAQLDEDPASPQPGQAWIKMPQRVLKVAVLVGEGEAQHLEILRVPMAAGSVVAQQYRLREYVNFVLLLMLGIAIAFQMPLVIVLLGWLGLASADWLRAQRKYAMLICGVASALLTPADVVSMLVMLLPLYGLYELGILLLVIAPASRVAEGLDLTGVAGRRWRWRRRDRSDDADEPPPPSGQTGEDPQTDSRVARSDETDQSEPDQTDAENDRT